MLFLSGLVLGFIAVTLTSPNPFHQVLWKIIAGACSVSCFFYFFK